MDESRLKCRISFSLMNLWTHSFFKQNFYFLFVYIKVYYQNSFGYKIIEAIVNGYLTKSIYNR